MSQLAILLSSQCTGIHTSNLNINDKWKWFGRSLSTNRTLRYCRLPQNSSWRLGNDRTGTIRVLWNATPHINLYESFAVKSETDKFFGSCPLGSYLQTVSAHLRFGKLEGNWDQVENVERAEQDGERERETERDREVLRDSEEIRLIDAFGAFGHEQASRRRIGRSTSHPFGLLSFKALCNPGAGGLCCEARSTLPSFYLTFNIFAGYVYWPDHVCSLFRVCSRTIDTRVAKCVSKFSGSCSLTSVDFE